MNGSATPTIKQAKAVADHLADDGPMIDRSGDDHHDGRVRLIGEPRDLFEEVGGLFATPLGR
jgi:hypothetical protein